MKKLTVRKLPKQPMPGMLLLHDCARDEWLPGRQDFISVIMDNATDEVYSMILAPDYRPELLERGVMEVVACKGLFQSLRIDAATSELLSKKKQGSETKKTVGMMLESLGISTRRTSNFWASHVERCFITHKRTLNTELSSNGVKDIVEANQYLRETYIPKFNAANRKSTQMSGTAFISSKKAIIDKIMASNKKE
jgi:hypothetical protein